jgi:hypothetical protein
MSTINSVTAGLHHEAGHSGAAVGVVAEGPAVKQGAAGVPAASPILSASTVVKLGAASLAPLTYDASLTRSVEHLRGGIAQYLGHGA